LETCAASGIRPDATRDSPSDETFADRPTFPPVIDDQDGVGYASLGFLAPTGRIRSKDGRTGAKLPLRALPASPLETELLQDVQSRLDRWTAEFADDPDSGRKNLLLLALEREQIVAVAYREETVAGRVALLDVHPDVRTLIHQTLVWIWKDEQMHAEYLRGELLRAGGVGPSAVVYGRQIQGAISGWTSATSNHRQLRTAPFRTATASALIFIAGAFGRIPTALKRELRFQTFHRYCELNVALEASAELAYRRLIELTEPEADRRTIERIREDEVRHKAAFALLAEVLDVDDRLVPNQSPQRLIERFSEISEWFIPSRLRRRKLGDTAKQSFGLRRPVVVRSGRNDHEKVAVLESCLDRAGLANLAAQSNSAAIRVSFMLGYDRRDRSNINDPGLVEAVARYLRRHGVNDVAVLEAPTVYGRAYGNRSVQDVASYFGFESSAYRLVDIGQNLRPITFERGFVQQAISGEWLDADLRIVMPKLRTDPTEFAHLSLSTLEGSTGPIDDTFYAGRQIDFRSATMMLLDVAPPHFSIVDAWAPVADGAFGVMGCSRPAEIRLIYAGADALSIDEVVLGDLGIQDPRLAPIVRRVYHWFALSEGDIPVVGVRPDLGADLRGAHASRILRALGIVSYPIYVYMSRRGELFVPRFDSTWFPPLQPISPVVSFVQKSAQRVFGLHAPDVDHR
jgi:uncharacterized protein (DUF362 family)